MIRTDLYNIPNNASKNVIILGLDPGSRVTGYGLLVCDNLSNDYHYLASGCIKITQQALGAKLVYIHRQISALIEQYAPSEVAIEQVFVKNNPSSAIKLGQARGAAIAAALANGASLAEYSPRAIKQAVVGYGHADKTQVQAMVKMILKLPAAAILAYNDESDALAIAICHVHARRLQQLQARAK